MIKLYSNRKSKHTYSHALYCHACGNALEDDFISEIVCGTKDTKSISICLSCRLKLQKSFDEEFRLPLKAVLTSENTGEDWNGLLYIAATREFRGNTYYSVIFSDGSNDLMSYDELNPNISSIRKYDPDRDPDFNFLAG